MVDAAREEPAAQRQHHQPGELQRLPRRHEPGPLGQGHELEVADRQLAGDVAQPHRQLDLARALGKGELLDIAGGRLRAREPGQPLHDAQLRPRDVAVRGQRDLADRESPAAGP